MIAIGLLYNHNGMATWCIETAHALHYAGYEVILVIDDEQRPDLKNTVYPFKTFFFRFKTNSFNTTLLNKISNYIRVKILGISQGLTSEIEKQLRNTGYNPTLFLLNQSDLFDTRCITPQFIVSWAYPTTLKGYILKALRQTPSFFNISTLTSLVNAVLWYRKDWKAYKLANAVIAVSERLTNLLKSKNINAHLLYPPLNIDYEKKIKIPNGKVKVLFIAVNLENPQKRIEWGVDMLGSFDKKDQLEIHFIGKYTYLKDKTNSLGLSTTFHGLLDRKNLVEIMDQCDILIFCSSFDDWGYVQVEGMSRGMVVIAPDISPSDEIIKNYNLIFQQDNKKSFQDCLNRIMDKDNLLFYKQYCKERSTVFDHNMFSKQIKKLLPEFNTSH